MIIRSLLLSQYSIYLRIHEKAPKEVKIFSSVKSVTERSVTDNGSFWANIEGSF
jgi:hypothetical protein